MNQAFHQLEVGSLSRNLPRKILTLFMGKILGSIYNQNGSKPGFGSGGKFAELSGAPVIDKSNLVVKEGIKDDKPLRPLSLDPGTKTGSVYKFGSQTVFDFKSFLRIMASMRLMILSKLIKMHLSWIRLNQASHQLEVGKLSRSLPRKILTSFMVKIPGVCSTIKMVQNLALVQAENLQGCQELRLLISLI